jgi:hypothetical protein
LIQAPERELSTFGSFAGWTILVAVSLRPSGAGFSLALGGGAVIEPASNNAALGLVGVAADDTEDLAIARSRRQCYLNREFPKQICAGPGKRAGEIVNGWFNASQFQPSLQHVSRATRLGIERLGWGNSVAEKFFPILLFA